MVNCKEMYLRLVKLSEAAPANVGFESVGSFLSDPLSSQGLWCCSKAGSTDVRAVFTSFVLFMAAFGLKALLPDSECGLKTCQVYVAFGINFSLTATAKRRFV